MCSHKDAGFARNGIAIIKVIIPHGKKILKKDNEEYFLREEPTKIYYTGPSGTFPSTIALNKLYYFMPYIKEKGVRDLYLIRVARIGNKAEIHPGSNDEEPRLVFELEYLESLPDYEMISLTRYWYKDTLLGRVFPFPINKGRT